MNVRPTNRREYASVVAEHRRTYQNSGATESRIGAWLAEAQRRFDCGQRAEAVAVQRKAADEARTLVDRFADDVRLRQGLGSILYNLASMRLAVGDLATAVRELDDCHDQYMSLIGSVADAELLCADVRARRGLTLAMRGSAASAIVDADAAVVAYLEVTGGDLDHPRQRDLARVLSMNAAVLARNGDPDLAVASANSALECYGYLSHHSPNAGIPEDNSYLHSAATVSALFNLAAGRIAEGFLPALVIVSNLPPGDPGEALKPRLAVVGELLAEQRRIPYPLDVGRGLAESLIPVVRGRGLLWAPDVEPATLWDPPGTGWPGGELPPTLAEVLGRHATGTDDAALVTALSTGQPQELLWTPSMRWLPDLPLTGALRLAELTTAVLLPPARTRSSSPVRAAVEVLTNRAGPGRRCPHW